ncbi:VWA domain-containing protein [Spartinivicinus poritis]|uniref:VWA domain-containing protein n=1 Tax=Spartinivicinus poritis TaxID=2994640 RepID=A0ABT5UH38_9GAMM|nr:VWA domain-containing protein [Spartinivicinus sp. A2-2]MDE1465708.1 VWA domain-containing protein [Spartinivicinus sp. A2-2]
MIELQSGGNLKIDCSQINISITWDHPSVSKDDIDTSAFLLNEQGKVRSDGDFIFYNQPTSVDNCIKLSTGTNKQSYTVDLDNIPADVHKIAFAIVIHSNGNFGSATSIRLNLEGTAHYQPSTQGMEEKALIMGQLYRHQGNWKFKALGQGYNGGLAPLATGYGVDIAEKPPADAETATPNQPIQSSTETIVTSVSSPKSIDLEKKLQAKAPRLINLAKPIKVCLEKKQLTDTRARVAFVLDASGSMTNQFKNGNVQAVLDRITTLAVQFDDDEALELWAFADKFKKYADVSLDNLDDYIEKLTKKNKKKRFFSSIISEIIEDLGFGNNEPPVISDIIESYQHSNLPAYIIFITDGGIYKDKAIEKLIKQASSYPIFWQFVGLGGSNYGVLERLDDLTGRTIDNADFFPIDDFKKVQDQELYERLLNEFPGWLREAQRIGILN